MYEEIINALKHIHQWKSPGIDRNRNFWLHHTSTNEETFYRNH